MDQNGRILRTNAPFFSLFSSVSRDAIDRAAPTFRSSRRDRPVFGRRWNARDRQADIAPIDVLPRRRGRHIRFYVNAVADGSATRARKSAIVYAVETTEQKALEGQMAQSQKMQAVGSLPAASRTTSTTC